MKRSISSPNVQQAGSTSAQNSSMQYSADKRRNKLGYHRTSVACGHCRRRKIRCLLSKDDTQGRCSNCIRLKKECNFFPVENTERRPRSLSKPDIHATEASSSGSSPSPGVGMGNLSSLDIGGSYPSSVPVTPTYDFPQSLLEQNQRHNSISSATSGRLSIPHSAMVSRRPSLANIIPSVGNDDYLNSPGLDSPGFMRHSYRMGSYSDLSSAQPEQSGLDSAFWRLTSNSPMMPMPNAYSIYPHQIGLGSVTSLHSVGTVDSQEDYIWPSRLNSIDHGMVPGIGYPPTSNSDAEIQRSVPALYNGSATASTASLTASLPEPSQYGDTKASTQIYSSQWSDASAVPPTLQEEDIKYESPYPFESQYHDTINDPNILFPSAIHSPKFVSQV